MKGIGKIDYTKTLIETDDKLPNDITFKKCCYINYMRYKR